MGGFFRIHLNINIDIYNSDYQKSGCKFGY